MYCLLNVNKTGPHLIYGTTLVFYITLLHGPTKFRPIIVVFIYVVVVFFFLVLNAYFAGRRIDRIFNLSKWMSLCVSEWVL